MALLTACAVGAQTAAQTKAPTPAPTPAQTAALTPAKPDPWAAVRFLLGSWEGKTTGGMAQAQAPGGYAFRLELRDHVMARHSRSSGCKSPDEFDCLHGDLLYIYPAGSGQGLEAMYFDNEGHVIHYALTTPKTDSVVMLSDPAPAGPQFRLSYDLVAGVMTGEFQVKMPGQADFTSYLEWSGKKQ
jgi:hypothetical protein